MRKIYIDTVIVLGVITPLLIELITYQGVIKTNIGIPAYVVSLILLGWTYAHKKTITLPYTSILLASLVILGCAIGLGYLNNLYGPNYIFSTFGIAFPVLNTISLILMLLAITQAPAQWLKKHAHMLVFYGSFVFVAVGLAYWFLPFDIFIEMNKEGHIVENTQFVILLITMGVCIQTARAIHKYGLLKYQNLKLLWLTSLCTALFAFFVAGEEISWGQFVFHYSIESIQETNVQDEVTLHNQEFIVGYIFQAYLIVALYGGMSWLIPYYIPRLRQYFFLFSEWYVSPYFLFLLVYLKQQRHYGKLGAEVRHWGEYTELALYFAFLYLIVRNYLHVYNFRQSLDDDEHSQSNNRKNI